MTASPVLLPDICRNGHIDPPRHGKRRTCGVCARLRDIRWRLKNPEKRKAILKNYADTHKTEAIARNKKWRSNNPEIVKEISRRSEQRRRGQRKCDPAKMKVLHRLWYLANKEKSAAYKRNRRGRETSSGTHAAEDIAEIFKHQKGKCAYCRTKVGKDFHIDHIKPLSKGGSNLRKNLQIACVPCNRSKGARDPNIFAREKFGLLI